MNILKVINSKHNQEYKFYKSLHLKKNRQIHQVYLIEGLHLLEMAKKAQLLRTAILGLNKTFSFGDTRRLSDLLISKLSQTKSPSNFLGLVSMNNCKIKYENNFIVLDEIQDPGNLGTILRSALAFGFTNIVLSKKCVDLYNSKVIRSTQGAHFFLNIFIMELDDFFDNFNGEILATSLGSDTKSLQTINKPKTPFCIIFGNEANGISQNTLKKSTSKIQIIINHKINSLNVAVAAGIIMNKFK